MHNSTWAVGSLAALRTVLDDAQLALEPNADVVVVPTAAAFVGATQAAVAVAQVFEGRNVRVEALMIVDRAASDEPYFLQRLAECDLLVLCDGSALHARAVWRNSRIGDAINAAPSLVVVGAVASALGDVMIDPRGGAPTIGLNFRPGVAFSPPASDEQLVRTRALLDGDVPLVVLGPQGAVHRCGEQWRVVRSEGVVVTRGDHEVIL